MERPDTRYFEVGGADVAYQIVGHGTPDLVDVSGSAQIDLRWDNRLPISAG